VIFITAAKNNEHTFLEKSPFASKKGNFYQSKIYQCNRITFQGAQFFFDVIFMAKIRE